MKIIGTPLKNVSGDRTPAPVKSLIWSTRSGLVAFWIFVFILSTACGLKGEDAFKALLGFLTLAVVSVALIGVALWTAVKSSVAAGVYVGIFLATIIEITIPPGVQFALIGGILGISLDKLASKPTAELPTTIIDRLALLVSRIADSIKDASIDAGNPIHIRSVRRGVWIAVLTILTTLLVGRAADNIGITGTKIFHLFYGG